MKPPAMFEVPGGLIFHPTIRDAIRRVDPDGALVAYQRAASGFLDEAVRTMSLDDVKARLQARTGKRWCVVADSRWNFDERRDVWETNNHFITYETKARLIVQNMKNDAVLA